MFSKKDFRDSEHSEVCRDFDSDNEIAISFEHVTKRYKLFKNERDRFLATFSNKVPRKEILANNDLSFTIRRGEAVSFLGCNGAGKSTALKIITGVAHPTSGRVTVHGRVSALLELSAGFDMKLSGRENIAFRGQLWGLSNEEIARLEPAIIDFAELGDYIDQPMRTYSSGMKARLGFAFASSIDPDILVVDEALSVGDRRFSRKCVDRVMEIMSDDKVTVLFVTHSSSSAKEFCKRGIVLEHGHNIYEGPIEDAVAFYEARNS